MKRALRPIITLTVKMMNHRSHRILPRINRSSVMANEVLLKVAARMEKVPVRLPTMPSVGKFSGGTA